MNSEHMNKIDLITTLVDALDWYVDWDDFPPTFDLKYILKELNALRCNWVHNEIDKYES